MTVGDRQPDRKTALGGRPHDPLHGKERFDEFAEGRGRSLRCLALRLKIKPGGTARRPATETWFGQGTTEIGTGATSGTGNISAPRFSGASSARLRVGTVATGAVVPSAKAR